MENEEKIIIGEKEYTREELLLFGMQHYPKFYWIYRGVGLGLLATALMLAVIAIPLIIVNYPYFWIYFILAAPFLITAIVLIAISFKKQPDENYIKHAVDYYTRVDARNKARQVKVTQRKEKEDVSQLLKYKKLLDAGVITEEEYENKKKELLE